MAPELAARAVPRPPIPAELSARASSWNSSTFAAACPPFSLFLPVAGSTARDRPLHALGRLSTSAALGTRSCTCNGRPAVRQRRMMDSSGCGDTDTNAALGHRPGPHFNVTRGRHMGRTNDMSPLRRHRTNGGVVGMACHCRRWCRELGLHTVTGRLEPLRVCVAALDATTSLLL